MDGDDVEIEVENDDGEMELKPYRANRYINEFYGGQDNCTEELFKKGLVAYQQIADLYDYTETLIKNAYEGATQNPQIGVRRALHVFFNKDLYEDRLDKYHSLCMGCKKRCKQAYWVGLTCSRYNKK